MKGVSNDISINACVCIAAGTCFPSCCLERNVVSQSFVNRGCFSGATVLTLSKYAILHDIKEFLVQISGYLLIREDMMQRLTQLKSTCWHVSQLHVIHICH